MKKILEILVWLNSLMPVGMILMFVSIDYSSDDITSPALMIAGVITLVLSCICTMIVWIYSLVHAAKSEDEKDKLMHIILLALLQYLYIPIYFYRKVIDKKIIGIILTTFIAVTFIAAMIVPFALILCM